MTTPNPVNAPELAEHLAHERDHNCQTIAAAIEDMHHRNLARMSLLAQRHDVTIHEGALLGMKFEILLDLVVGADELQRLQVGFAFQQRLANHLNDLEHQTKEH